ncbi:hypothetical protein ALI144C_07500 [Actinosynnema sp. ALI-1.44]|nr:hypothetical protein ALI144C_07500 [Actinosynnema sp. ALI-1.44]
MIGTVWRTRRSRRSGFVGAFIALFFAAATATSAGILLESGARAESPPERYAGAAVVVGGKQSYDPPADVGNPDAGTGESVVLPERVRLDRGMVDRIARIDGVLEAVPDLSFPANLLVKGQPLTGPNGTRSWGHGWDSARLMPFTVSAGRPPRAGGEVLVDAQLAARARVAVGQDVQISIHGRPETFRLVGTAAGGSPLTKQAALFFAPDEAARLSGNPTGKIDTIGVLAAPGTGVDELAARITGTIGEDQITALTGGQRGYTEFLDLGNSASNLVALSGSFGGVGLAIVLFVVAATFALSVHQRRREIALLRAVGATPGQIRRMVAAEALMISVPAALAGAVLGIPLATWLRKMLVAGDMIPDTLALHIGVLPAVVGVGSTVLVALAATYVAGRQASKASPTEALGEAAAPRRLIGGFRLSLGLLLLAGSITLVTVSRSATGDGAPAVSLGLLFALILTVVVLSPLLVRVAAAVLGMVISRFSPGSGYLAAANSRANARRLAPAVSTMVLAVGFACTEIFLQTTLLYAAATQAAGGSVADHVVVGGDTRLSPEVVAAVRQVDGVDAATGITYTKVLTGTFDDLDMSAVPAQAVDTDDLAAAVDLDVRSGDLGALRGESVALSQSEATVLGLAVGDLMPVRLGDGTLLKVKIVATYGRGLGYGDVTLPAALVAGHTTDGLTQQVLVRAQPGADQQRVRTELAGLAARFPGLTVTEPHEALAARDEDQRANQWGAFLVTGVIVVYTAIAVINTLAMTTSARTREFALLQLIGATRQQVLRMARWESVMLIVTAIVFGSVVAVTTLVPFSLGRAQLGFPYTPPLVYLGILGGIAVIGLFSVMLPAHRVLRQRPVEVAGVHE